MADIEDAPSTEFSDLPPEPPARSGRTGAVAFVLTIVVLGLLGGAAYLGRSAIAERYADLVPFTNRPNHIKAWLADAPLGGVNLPAGYHFTAAYRHVFDDKGLRLFIATTAGDPAGFPKDPVKAMDLAAISVPRYYVFVAVRPETDLDGAFEKVSLAVEAQGPTQTLSEKIWVADEEVPGLFRETKKGNAPYRTLLVPFAGNGILLAAAPADRFASGPNAAMLGTLLDADPSRVSFAPPDPPGLKLARLVVSGDAIQRKQAVPQLAALGGPQPEAVSFLSSAVSTSSAEVKPDVVAALGLLAPNNPDAIAPLVGALSDREARIEAMAALGSLGPTAGAAIPALKAIAANKRESAAVRNAARRALLEVEGRPAPVARPRKGRAPAKKRPRRR